MTSRQSLNAMHMVTLVSSNAPLYASALQITSLHPPVQWVVWLLLLFNSQHRVEHKIGLKCPSCPCVIELFRGHVWEKPPAHKPCPLTHIYSPLIPPMIHSHWSRKQHLISSKSFFTLGPLWLKKFLLPTFPSNHLCPIPFVIDIGEW